MGDNAWQKVTKKKSMEDLTQRIFKSVFITNFPDHFSARDLWMVCKGYGTVVDVYIPNRKSKAGIKPNHTPVVSIPSMVLDDSHIVHRDLSFHVMGEAKQFMSIQKLPTILSKEGFSNVKLTYLGGLWVMMEFSSLITKEKFLHHVGVASWFNSLSNAQPYFVSKERIVWVDIEGVPLHLWSHATFTKIGSKWGELLEMEELKDDLFARKRLCIKTKQEDNILENFKILIHDDGVSDTYFGHDDKDEHQQQSNQMNQASEDPFQIYDLLKKQDNEAKSESEKTYPLGFTPDAEDNKKVEDKVSSLSVGFNSRTMADSPPIEDQISSHDVQHSYMNNNKKGGSILEVMDDMIKLG
ncbi:RNA-directed DNA polymerase, eukaryota [Tanacetum coccineum]